MPFVDLGFSGEMRVVDVETTGLYPRPTKRDPSEHNIISVCVMPIHFSGGNPATFGYPETWVVNPGRAIPYSASKVNGFYNTDVEGKPRFAEVSQEIRDAIGQHPLVGHNVTFDKRFLRAEFERVGGLKSIARCKPICTMRGTGALMYAVGRHASKWDHLSLDRAISLFSGGKIGRSGKQHSAQEDVMIAGKLASILNELAHLPKMEAKERIREAVENWPEEAQRRERYRERYRETKATQPWKTSYAPNQNVSAGITGLAANPEPQPIQGDSITSKPCRNCGKEVPTRRGKMILLKCPHCGIEKKGYEKTNDEREEYAAWQRTKKGGKKSSDLGRELGGSKIQTVLKILGQAILGIMGGLVLVAIIICSY